MSFILRIDQEAPISLAFIDTDGQPATVNDPPVWINPDDTMVTLVVADDGLSTVVTPVGPVGEVTISLAVEDHTIELLHISVLEIAFGEMAPMEESEVVYGPLRIIVTAGPARMPPIP